MSQTLKEENAQSEKKKNRRSSPLSAISFIVASIAFVISLYCTWQLHMTTKQTRSEMRTTQTKANKTNETTNQMVGIFKKALTDLKSESQVLQKHISAIATKQNQNESDWQLVKAKHLMDIAALSIYWEKTTHPAIGLLETADTLVGSLNDPKYTPLRQALSDEIMSLKAVPKVDTIGLLTKLDTLQGKINQLPLQTETLMKNKKETEPDTKKAPPPKWREALNNSMKTISKLVVVRYQNKAVSPLLSPEDRLHLIEQIQLTLQQAQWAVIQKNQSLYTFSLKESIDAISEHFNTDDKMVKAELESLTALKKEIISPALPTTNKAKRLLDTLLLERRGVNA
jgi:uroporphyrin-3 C-methyltransferase